MKCRKMNVKKGNKENACNAIRVGALVKIFGMDGARVFEETFATVSKAKAFFAQDTISLQ